MMTDAIDDLEAKTLVSPRKMLIPLPQTHTHFITILHSLSSG